MKRLIVICEGQTEHEFCKDVLYPALMSRDIFVQAPLIKRSQGGIVGWQALKRQIELHLQEPGVYVTMLIDYYGIKDSLNFPGWEESKFISSKNGKHDLLLKRMKEDISTKYASRFIPYMQFYEFEALIFSDLNVILENFGSKDVDIEYLQKTLKESLSPEDINNSPDTAPSKRLLKAIPGYDKAIYGSCLTSEIGLEKIIDKCPLFANWYHKISGIQ